MASDRQRRATIEDVASAAGVSVATVSRALRGLPNVAFSTRERVARIAADLAYQPDPAAARLATGRSRAIALMVPVLNSWYFSQVVAGAEAVCAEAGYDVLVMGVASAEARRSLLGATSIDRRVDGLVVVDVPLDDRDLDELAALGQRDVAIVTIGTTTAQFPSLGIDDIAVAALATEHLLDLGHTRIALLTGQPEDPYGFDVPHLRRTGYEHALARAGISADPSLQQCGNFSVTGGREATEVLLSLDHPPTAMFAMSDEMAFGALHALRVRGVSVPDGFSVIGVDDHDVSTVLGLTTVRQPVAEHGARAARLVLEGLTGSPLEPIRHESPVELVVRSSTGPRNLLETSPTP